MNSSLLLIDDNRHVLESLKYMLRKEFNTIKAVTNPNVIPATLNEQIFDLYLLDMNFRAGIHSGNEGIFWLREILKTDPEAVVVMITAYGDVNLAVRAMKEGASDFILKPWNNEVLIETLRSGLRLRKVKLKTTDLDLKTAAGNEIKQEEIFRGISLEMQKVYNTVSRVAATDANVLILGENGTGKEVIAKEIHAASNRKDRIFMNVDMGALPDTLVESELFGHEKGAFTDAHEKKYGKFEAANGGTLFLDEIGNLPLSSQGKLLSVLESRKVTRLGSNKPVPVDLRLISATNQSLTEMMRKGEFREDLYYRLNTLSIDLPPLRERREDIPGLAEYFMKIFRKKYHRSISGISKEAVKKLKKYSWPGNIREFKHSIEKAVILSSGKELESADFNFPFARNNETLHTNQPQTLDELEKKAIVEAISRNRGNLTDTAAELGISRPTLYRKMEKFGL